MARAIAALARRPAATIATRPIPVHAIREDPGRGRWADRVPMTGWLFPASDAGIELFVHVPRLGKPGVLASAASTRSLSKALDMALSSADGSSEPANLRLVETPEGDVAFWIEGDMETFVDLAHARIMSGPEFVSEFLPGRALSMDPDGEG